MTHTHVTAPTQFVEANGIRFAYRRFGRDTREPLLFMQHFRGGMDHWDPAITDGFAMDRPVILFNNAGVASSSGETPNTVDAMGDYAADFVGALGLSHVDVLGFSIGGYIAQALTLRHPALVKRLMLVGTGPRAGEPPTDPKYSQYGTSTDPGTGETGLEAFLYLFFSPSTSSQAAGRAFWERRHLRRKDIDPPSSAQAMKAQLAALRLESFFEAVTFSSEVGVRKPHPRIYADALFKLGVEPRNALFVGDRVKEDIQGPKTLGMRAVLTREWRQEEDPGLADFVIQRLGELPAIISRLTPRARSADTYNEVTSRE